MKDSGAAARIEGDCTFAIVDAGRHSATAMFARGRPPDGPWAYPEVGGRYSSFPGLEACMLRRFILRQRVLGWMPIRAAVTRLFQLFCLRAS